MIDGWAMGVAGVKHITLRWFDELLALEYGLKDMSRLFPWPTARLARYPALGNRHENAPLLIHPSM
jgi:hypothetical protein